MTKRPAYILRAIGTAVLAFTSIAVIVPSAGAAPSDCLLIRPTTAPPSGQYWLHLMEPGKNRRCWVLRAKLERPAQARASRSVQAARTGARAAELATSRATEAAAINQSSTPADLPQHPPIADDRKTVWGTDAPQAVSSRAEQDQQHAEAPDAKASDSETLLLLDAGAPEIAGTQAAAGASIAPPASSSSQAPDTNGHANLEASEPSAAPIAASKHPPRTIGALGFLQMLFVAMFFGPALYLFAAGAIRRLIGVGHRSPDDMRLSEPPAPHALLPPRLEPSESGAQS